MESRWIYSMEIVVMGIWVATIVVCLWRVVLAVSHARVVKLRKVRSGMHGDRRTCSVVCVSLAGLTGKSMAVLKHRRESTTPILIAREAASVPMRRAKAWAVRTDPIDAAYPRAAKNSSSRLIWVVIMQARTALIYAVAVSEVVAVVVHPVRLWKRVRHSIFVPQRWRALLAVFAVLRYALVTLRVHLINRWTQRRYGIFAPRHSSRRRVPRNCEFSLQLCDREPVNGSWIYRVDWAVTVVYQCNPVNGIGWCSLHPLNANNPIGYRFRDHPRHQVRILLKKFNSVRVKKKRVSPRVMHIIRS